jgi:putative acetyltransferase
VQIRAAETAADLDSVRRLLRGFLQWHRSRAGADPGRLDQYFDEEGWAAELAGLPGQYAEPSGALLLAGVDGVDLGCVALRRLDAGRCEMKRMFVDDAGRGQGLGRALALAIVARGRELGYTEMYLDTGPTQQAAIGLYRHLGFEEVDPYYDVPDAVRDWLLYFRLAL